MRILLTRPPEEASRTAETLKAKGHDVTTSSVLEVQPRDAAWPNGIIDAVMATSAQAFEQAQFPADLPLPEALRLMRLYVVGGKTGEAARRCGFLGELKVAQDAKELADIVVQHFQPPARLAYLAGHDRKADLEARCKEARLDIIAVEIYEARAASGLSKEAVAGLKGGAFDAVLHYSRRSAEIFLKLADAAGVKPGLVRHIAISADAAAPLRAADLPRVMVAAEPKEQAIIALLSSQKSAPAETVK